MFNVCVLKVFGLSLRRTGVHQRATDTPWGSPENTHIFPMRQLMAQCLFIADLWKYHFATPCSISKSWAPCALMWCVECEQLHLLLQHMQSAPEHPLWTDCKLIWLLGLNEWTAAWLIMQNGIEKCSVNVLYPHYLCSVEYIFQCENNKGNISHIIYLLRSSYC